MKTFKTLSLALLPAAMTLGIVATDASAQAAAPLTVQVYNADGGSFHVNAVLVAGKSDAVLLDTGFTRADAMRIAAMVLDSKKTLKTVYISQADPDYYFGIEVINCRQNMELAGQTFYSGNPAQEGTLDFPFMAQMVFPDSEAGDWA